MDLVREGYDVAIRAGHVRDEGVVARPLADNARVLVASEDYLALQGTPLEPKELETHVCLLFRYVGSTDTWRFRRGDALEPVRVSGPISSNSGDLLVDSALAGVGIVLAPYWLVAHLLAEGSLCRVLAAYDVTATDFDSKVNLIYPSRRFMPGSVRALLAFLADKFDPPLWADIATAR